MTRQELEHQLLSLSLSDKAAMVQSLTQTLSIGDKGITKTPGVCGGEACIAGTRMLFGSWSKPNSLAFGKLNSCRTIPTLPPPIWSTLGPMPQPIAKKLPPPCVPTMRRPSAWHGCMRMSSFHGK